MTVSMMKTEFVKSDPLQIRYRNYKHFEPTLFNSELKATLDANTNSTREFNVFHEILNKLLDKHAPIKKKQLRANNSQFMTKPLRKMMMNRSKCKNAYYNNKNAENWEKYRILRNKCAKMTKRVKREYFSNLNITSGTDNKKFWKTIKPFFSEKNTTRPKITIVEKDKVVTNNCEIAGIMNEYFVNITKNLNIPNIVLESTPGNLNNLNVDHIDEIIQSYSKHSSIQKIKEIVNSTVPFRFDKTNETRISNEILALNSDKASGPDNIPSKVLKICY